MRKKISTNLFILAFILLIPSTFAWGRSIITGQVVDAETGKPIENAAVHIYWGKPGEGPPGLAAKSVEVEVAEDLTDAEGFFEIPKYCTLFKHYDLAVYKKGYVCWSSRKIFPTYKKRKGFRLKDGMVIKLECFKEEYSREDHARFTVFSEIGTGGPGLFDDAIKSERELRYRTLQRNRRK